MPIYEYQCLACGHKLEALQKISDSPLTDCPDCRQPQLKKLVSASAFRLGGSGWYETDFKSGNKKNLLGDKADNSVKSGDTPGKDKPTGDSVAKPKEQSSPGSSPATA